MVQADTAPESVLHASLATRAELHHFRLNQHFPKRVKECQMEISPTDGHTYLIVHFVNGHKVRRLEREVQSSEFLALCGMLYDLPPKI